MRTILQRVRTGRLSDLIRAKVSRITAQWKRTSHQLSLINPQRKLIAPQSGLIRAKASRITAKWMRAPS